MDDECSHDILSNMSTFNEIIHRGLERGHMLVHCLAGVSRSVTAIASYLISTLGFSAPQAVCIIREGRPRAGPNDGFCNQLTVFEKRIQREKGGRVVTEDAVAKRQIEQALAEGGKFSNFNLARRIILEKQEEAPIKYEIPNIELSLHCKNCEKFLVEWDDLMDHDPTCSLLKREDSVPCNSYFTVWDKKTRDRGTITFAKKCENADLKMLSCSGCHNEIGEVDAWYGVKCSCGDLVLPGYQILKDKVTVKEKVHAEVSV